MSIIPDTDDVRDIGSSAKRFRDGSFISLKLGVDGMDVREQMNALISINTGLSKRIDEVSSGTTGDTGPDGAVGPQGTQGIIGATGPQGIQGSVGSTGPQGIDGVAGDTGAVGPQGVVGSTGPQGIDGVAGAAGPSGSDADASRTQNITATPGVTIITGRIDLAQTSLALGYSAGKTAQSTTGIAIGLSAGYTGQAENAISLGNMAGQTGQGRNSIALGHLSGYYQQAPYSTVINSSGEQINGAIERGMYMAPIRNTSEGTTYALRYNPSTKEITYE
jgi:hypothetical protein